MNSPEYKSRPGWFYAAFRLLAFSITPKQPPSSVVVTIGEILRDWRMPIDRFLPDQAGYPTTSVDEWDLVTAGLSNMSGALEAMDPAVALSVVKIMSDDPMAAARAAAILKMVRIYRSFQNTLPEADGNESNSMITTW